MSEKLLQHIDYERPVQIADGIYWIGFYDKPSGLHCNPYIIIDGGEAVVIDGGSRPDFPTVMMKILQTGINPSCIKALIYQHYDPDLCGSIPNFEATIDRKHLEIISDAENNLFIKHYAVSSTLSSLEKYDHLYRFSSGRTIRFINTPYAHSPGSFVSFDEKTGVLFTSDIFGSYGKSWELFLSLYEECATCTDYSDCIRGSKSCMFPGILEFHKKIMTSNKALLMALDRISSVPYKIIAPQHGSVIGSAKDAKVVVDKLRSLEDIGIDGVPFDGVRVKSQAEKALVVEV